jgi:hypothetical protein
MVRRGVAAPLAPAPSLGAAARSHAARPRIVATSSPGGAGGVPQLASYCAAQRSTWRNAYDAPAARPPNAARPAAAGDTACSAASVDASASYTTRRCGGDRLGSAGSTKMLRQGEKKRASEVAGSQSKRDGEVPHQRHLSPLAWRRVPCAPCTRHRAAARVAGLGRRACAHRPTTCCIT